MFIVFLRKMYNCYNIVNLITRVMRSFVNENFIIIETNNLFIQLKLIYRTK